MSLLAPLCRITIGKDDEMDEFLVGDGLLQEAKVDIGEDDRSNSCSFVIFDPNQKYAQKYFEVLFKQGGFDVPEELLQAPQPAPTTNGTTAAGGTSTTANTTLTPEMRAFLDVIAYSEGADYNVMFGGGTFSSYADHPRQKISGGGYTSTAAGRYQFLSSTWDEVSRQLNLTDFSPANQDLAGAQLVRRRGAEAAVNSRNFAEAVRLCGREWASFPGSPYGQPTHPLSELQKVWEEALARYSGSAPAAPAAQPQVVDTAPTKPVEQSNRGTEIIIELGYEVGQLEAFHFIHTGQRHNRASSITTFEGKAVRWVMSRRDKNTSYENITLRQLAEQICAKYRVTLEMEGDGPNYQFLDQTGISDIQLLIREARAVGYTVREEGTKLIIKPMRAEFTGFVLDEQTVIDLNFGDQASADRIVPAPSTVTVYSQPKDKASQNTASIDRLTGKVQQNNPEDTTGTGVAPGTTADQAPSASTTATTGSPDPPVTGTPANTPATSSGNETETANSSGSAPSGRSIDAAVAAIPLESVIPANELAAMRAEGLTEDQIENIRRQRAEAKVLEDEKNKKTGESSSTATASQTRAEAGRIGRGFESSADLYTTPEVLKLTPGKVIAISNSIVRDVFAREWRINRVSHTFNANGLRTSLQFYTPVALKDQPAAASSSATYPALNLAPGSWTMPAAAWKGKIGDGVGMRSATRRHNGIDIACGGDMLAASDGVVIACKPSGATCVVGDKSCGGRGGNVITIQHANGLYTRYMHMATGSYKVKEGDQVKAGQPIGVIGSTGDSSGTHVHFEVRKGSPTGEVLKPSDVGLKIDRSDLYQPGDWNQFKY